MKRTPAVAPVIEPGAPTGLGAWFDRCLALRDRWLASPVFQRRATAFAPTRWLARRRAGHLFDLVAGFVYSQALTAAVRLRLFEVLAEAPQPAEALAERLALPLDSMRRLLDALVALRLVERRTHDRYGLGPLGAPMVGNAALIAMVEHHAALYQDLAAPVRLLRAAPADRRSTALSGYWAYDAAGQVGAPPLQADASVAAPAAAAVAAYTRLMSASQPLVAGEVLDAWPLARHCCLLDVGGGDGRFLVSAAERAPGLRLMLFDLPQVAAHARARLAAAGLGERATIVGGSFLTDALPTGADVISLVRVVHDHDDPAAMRLLRAVHAALPPGGTLLRAEPMAATKGAEAMGDAYFGIYLLAMGQGQPRRPERLGQMLVDAGFDRIRSIPTRLPLQTGLIVARRRSA